MYFHHYSLKKCPKCKHLSLVNQKKYVLSKSYCILSDVSCIQCLFVFMMYLFEMKKFSEFTNNWISQKMCNSVRDNIAEKGAYCNLKILASVRGEYRVALFDLGERVE